MKGQTKQANLRILFSMIPEGPGERFVQVRLWETPDEKHMELVLEHGTVDEKGDLKTQCVVMPVYYTLDQVMQSVMGKAPQISARLSA